MPLNGGLVEGVQDPGLESLGRVCGNSELARDSIGGQKTNAKDLLGQSVGVRTNDVDRPRSIAAEGLDRDPGGDPVAGEENHDLLDAAKLIPGLADAVHGHAPNAADL